MIKEWGNFYISKLESYVNSFSELSEQQLRNFEIKKDHSLRVADIALLLSKKLEFPEEHIKAAFLSGLFHDIGRFKQLKEYETFSDDKSVDHADVAIEILEDGDFLSGIEDEFKGLILVAIKNHNKFKIEDGLSEAELKLAQLLRDADKLDILKVISDYYTKRNSTVNHTLVWDLPKGSAVSESVIKEVLAGKLVSKKNIVSELDAKIMQLSWVYDINYKPAIEYLMDKRYLEIIYNTLSKNDTNIEIYRKIKVFAENLMLKKS